MLGITKTSSKILSIVSFGLLATMVFASPAWSAGIVSPGETLTFTESDAGEGTPTFNGNPSTSSSFDIFQNRAEATTLILVGAINESVSSFGQVRTGFDVTSSSSGAETLLDATVSADVQWFGVLFGFGIVGAEASVKIEMILTDETTGLTTGKFEVLSDSQDSLTLLGIEAGGTEFSGDERITFTGKVVRGHLHSLALRVTCSSNSGFIGVDVGCVFQSDVFGLGLRNGFAKWDSLAITVEQDQIELLTKMDAKLDEVIRLLHTPQGRRSSDVPACGGAPCDYPENPIP